jgi:hypothetical protein
MARIKNTSTGSNMGRDRISSPSKDLMKAAGTALFSIVKGEQLHVTLTAAWMTNLSSANIVAKVVEGNNDGTGAVPTEQASSPVIRVLPLLDADVNDNEFKIVFPEDLIDTWSTQPGPDKPVYGFIGLEIDDGGIGNAKQVWKPLRGLVEVLYSPSEAV